MKLTARQTRMINEILCDDVSRVVKGRKLRNAMLKESGHNYDMPLDNVVNNWQNELDDAIEFISCTLRVDTNTATGHVKNNWVFGTLDHNGQTYLLARDEATNDALAYKKSAGGWYRRLGDNEPRCHQKGANRGMTAKAYAPRTNSTKSVEKSGTAVSGEATKFADSVILEMLRSGYVNLASQRNLRKLANITESYAIDVMGADPDMVFHSEAAILDTLSYLIKAESF